MYPSTKECVCLFITVGGRHRSAQVSPSNSPSGYFYYTQFHRGRNLGLTGSNGEICTRIYKVT